MPSICLAHSTHPFPLAQHSARVHTTDKHTHSLTQTHSTQPADGVKRHAQHAPSAIHSTHSLACNTITKRNALTRMHKIKTETERKHWKTITQNSRSIHSQSHRKIAQTNKQSKSSITVTQSQKLSRSLSQERQNHSRTRIHPFSRKNQPFFLTFIQHTHEHIHTRFHTICTHVSQPNTQHSI